MARMHSRKRGQSGSHRPLGSKGVPQWVDYKKEEVVKLVLKLRSQEHSTAMIGTILKDQYGIPSVSDIVGKTITEILRENNQYHQVPEDVRNLLKRAVQINEHLTENKKDYHSKRGLFLTESKIRRLVKYYKSKGTLPENWTYERDRAKLLIQ